MTTESESNLLSCPRCKGINPAICEQGGQACVECGGKGRVRMPSFLRDIELTPEQWAKADAGINPFTGDPMETDVWGGYK